MSEPVSPESIEVMAREHYRVHVGRYSQAWDDLLPEQRDGWRNCMAAALSAYLNAQTDEVCGTCCGTGRKGIALSLSLPMQGSAGSVDCPSCDGSGKAAPRYRVVVDCEAMGRLEAAGAKAPDNSGFRERNDEWVPEGWVPLFSEVPPEQGDTR